MNSTPHLFLLAAIAISAVATFGIVWAKERVRRSRHREEHLQRAVQYLRIHYESLENLDDDATPFEMLELALWFSRFIHNPATPALIQEILARGEEISPDSVGTGGSVSTAFLEVQSRRPDLTGAFATAAVSGLMAFVERRPDCAAWFEPILLRIVSSPGTETERVAQAARAIRSHDRDDVRWRAPAAA